MVREASIGFWDHHEGFNGENEINALTRFPI